VGLRRRLRVPGRLAGGVIKLASGRLLVGVPAVAWPQACLGPRVWWHTTLRYRRRVAAPVSATQASAVHSTAHAAAAAAAAAAGGSERHHSSSTGDCCARRGGWPTIQANVRQARAGSSGGSGGSGGGDGDRGPGFQSVRRRPTATPVARGRPGGAARGHPSRAAGSARAHAARGVWPAPVWRRRDRLAGVPAGAHGGPVSSASIHAGSAGSC
jgi:hypothetical protein